MSRRREPRVRLDLAFAGAAADASGRLFAVACPNCHEELAVTTDMAEGEARCPVCSAPFTVPEPRTAEPAVPRAVAPSPLPVEPAAAPSAPPFGAGEPAPTPTVAAEPLEPVAAAHAPAVALSEDAAPSSAVPADPAPEGAAATITPEAPRGELEFREPVASITVGDTTLELRRLSPEEKQARRTRRNLLMLVVGAAILFALVLFLGRT